MMLHTYATGATSIINQHDIQNADNLLLKPANRTRASMFGKRTATVQNVQVDIWDGPTGTYVFPPAGGIQMEVVSADAADALAGTGIQKVMIHYLDDTYTEQTEIVSLDGTTPVDTVATNILRINGFHAQQVGSGAMSAGAISLRNTAGTVTYSVIPASNTASRQAIYTIPANTDGYITLWRCSSGSAVAGHFTQITLYATVHDGEVTDGIFLPIDEMGLTDDHDPALYTVPLRIPPTADVKVSAISDNAAANVTVTSSTLGYLETRE